MTSNIFPDIVIQPGLIDKPFGLSAQQVMIVTDTQVAALYLDRLINTLKKTTVISQVDYIIIPQGDDHKSLMQADLIFTQLIQNRHRRDTLLIALGGGMIGDLTGFCAACYLRGVAFIQMPTTLLAQVDAAIGGKVAVNHPLGKNLIGAFYQPKKILCDTSLLASLAQREWASGLAEVVKYGLILDPALFYWLENNLDAVLARQPESVDYMVRHCAHLKMDIVSQDEKDNGSRAFLNFGHTLGHALEAVFNFKTLLHGEAVSIGLIAAVMLSEKIGHLESTILIRLKKLLTGMGLPIQIPAQVSVDELIQMMKVDKKNRSGKLSWVLVSDLGVPQLSIVPESLLREILCQLGAQVI